MAQREDHVTGLMRFRKLDMLREAYPDFVDFLHAGMEFLGFSATDIQEDIARFLADGPDYLMVMAQRGEAKTTITALFAVWSLIHDPTTRILIFSAGGKQASEISTLIVRMIMFMPELECMRPDTTNGDRSSVEHFDVHYTLKGVDKSPSVKCLGITANSQGSRADILIADDVESSKNSATPVQREQLMHLTRDFSSVTTGNEDNPPRIIWLGTPQTGDSIYNSLPGRGVQVRIWPGRYPTPDQMKNYGDMLAPLITRRLRAKPDLATGGGIMGDQGKPTDPQLFNENKLQAKELDQGTAYFQLQHMLNTRLADGDRYPLKATDLTLLQVKDRAPLTVVRGMLPSHLVIRQVAGSSYQVKTPHETSQDTAKFAGILAYVDPAGGGANADETGYAIIGYLNGTLYLLEVGGLPGGYSQENLTELARRLANWKPNRVVIEKNMGFGAFAAVFTPILAKVHECSILEDYVTGQKETRIIGTIEPVLSAGRLVITDHAIHQDHADSLRYPAKLQSIYSFMFQMTRITKDRGCLVHDDRVDAVEGAVRFVQNLLKVDSAKVIEQQRAREFEEWRRNPVGYTNQVPPSLRAKTNSAISRFLKRKS
jgi:hypothetical protein